jgi:hypothetical protein
VWEWCSDWYRPDTYASLASRAAVVENPRGPDASFDPSEPGARKRVQRGGSFLCTDEYCSRYMSERVAGARSRRAATMSGSAAFAPRPRCRIDFHESDSSGNARGVPNERSYQPATAGASQLG